MPKFSIVTITFNNRKGLACTATSILMQSNTDYEWIIVDGASNDGTNYDFLDYQFAHIISEKDKGIYDAMNKGINHSTGDYIIFMNAGDVFASPNVLAVISAAIKPEDEFIYGDSLEDHQTKKARHHSRIKWGMFTHHQAMIYSRKALGNLRYDLSYRIAADYDLTLRFLKEITHTRYIPYPFCIFETGGISQTNAGLGRNEQFLSRKQNHLVSNFENSIIKSAQQILWTIRSKNKKTYWLIKAMSSYIKI